MLHYGRDSSDGASMPPAALRLYTYRAHCALVGRFQNLADEVDLAACRELDVQVGRRSTGGGAILMGPAQLGVAIAMRAPGSIASTQTPTPRQILQQCAEGVIAGLEALGVEASFRSKNDLEIDGRKIAGLGLYLDPRGALLFHASVLVDLDVPLMLRVLCIPGAKFSDKAVGRVEERVTTLSRELGRTLEAGDIRNIFATGVARALAVELVDSELDSAELQRQAELVRVRYGTQRWVDQSSPRRDGRGTAMLKTPEGLLRIHVGVHGESIKSALVAGDFNLLPPGLAEFERRLKWCRAERESIVAAARAALSDDDLGVTPEAVGETVWKATRRALNLQRRAHPIRAQGSCYFPEPGTTDVSDNPSRPTAPSTAQEILR